MYTYMSKIIVEQNWTGHIKKMKCLDTKNKGLFTSEGKISNRVEVKGDLVII